jgi:hypothetical protein
MPPPRGDEPFVSGMSSCVVEGVKQVEPAARPTFPIIGNCWKSLD